MPIVNRSSAEQAWLQTLQAQRAIAVIRADCFDLGLKMAAAVAQAGMSLIEITWNSDRPADLIATLREQYSHCQIGVGTLLSQEDFKAAFGAGAQFAFSPHTDPRLIELAIAHDCPIIPGALSPTEILLAWQSGATCVKVFPAQSIGGPQYVQNLQGPLGHIPLIPTGGVTYHSAPHYLQAGAIAVGVAGCLFQPKFIQAQDWLGLVRHIQRFQQQLQADCVR